MNSSLESLNPIWPVPPAALSPGERFHRAGRLTLPYSISILLRAWRRWSFVPLFVLLSATLCPHIAVAQGTLTNGWTHQGVIVPAGEIDSWTFSASLGERIVIRVGKITQTNSFTPRLRLMNPLGTQQATSSGAAAAEVAVTATNTGTFTVTVDGVAANATGTYRLTLAKSPGTISVAPGDEGGPLINGIMHTGTIDVGDLDVWTFSANSGDALVLRIGKITDTNAFTPWIRLYGSNGALLDSGFGALAGEVEVRATNSGTFLVVVSDGNNVRSGSGDYRLTLAKTGDPVVVSAGDNGGPMTNGVMHLGTVLTGDLDLWTFSANSGDALVLRIGKITDTNAFTPWIRLYGPNGALLDSGFGAFAGEVEVTATNSGTFLVVVSDGNNVRSGSGDYRLTLAKTGDPVVVSAGDNGGPLNGASTYDGIIDAGDLDLFYFTACDGDSLVLQIDELVNGSSLTPWLRLYGRDGRLIKSVSGAATALISVQATNTGTFTLLVGDGNTVLSGTGAYRLTVNGLSAGLKLCVPIVAGTNLDLSGVGGVNGGEFVVLTSPLVETSLPTWTPLFTNLFDFYGTFNRTSRFISTEPRRFFILQQR